LPRGETEEPASYPAWAWEVVNTGFTAISFDLDNQNTRSRDISDDPHLRKQWVKPYNRTIGSAGRRWMVSM
jgi:hypothetical protein